MGKILAFSGSLRKESLNKKLLMVAVEGARAAGAEVTVVDFKEYSLPIYDGDYEELHGLPKGVKELKALFWDHEGLLIASPENNSSLSAALKNVIDWVSRPQTPDEPFLSCFLNKKAALMSASIGYMGGVRGLMNLAHILRNVMVTVLPQQKILPFAQEAFDQYGKIKESKTHEEVKEIGVALATALQ